MNRFENTILKVNTVLDRWLGNNLRNLGQCKRTVSTKSTFRSSCQVRSLVRNDAVWKHATTWFTTPARVNMKTLACLKIVRGTSYSVPFESCI